MSKSMTAARAVAAASAFAASATSPTYASSTCGGSAPTETDDGQAAHARRRAVQARRAALGGTPALARRGTLAPRDREAPEAVAQAHPPAARARPRAQAAALRA